MSIKKPTRAEGIERIRTLYAVLAGIPNDKVELGDFIDPGWTYGCAPPTAMSVKTNCGSTACALGWAALWPPFQKLGLHTTHNADVRFGEASYLNAAEDFFAISFVESRVLFNDRWANGSELRALRKVLYKGLPRISSEAFDKISDKRIALHRLRRWLELTDAITPERSAELAEIEKGY